MILPSEPSNSNGNNHHHHNHLRAYRDNRRLDKFRARRAGKEWEVRLKHEFIQSWGRVLHPFSFLVFTILEMFADWRPGDQQFHTRGYQTLADLCAFTGADAKTVRRALHELEFYSLITYSIAEWEERRRSGKALDLVVNQSAQVPKVLYNNHFQKLTGFKSSRRRADIGKNGEWSSPQNGEWSSPQNGEWSSPQNGHTPLPKMGSGLTSIASNSQHTTPPPASSSIETPAPTTTAIMQNPNHQEVETLAKTLPTGFDHSAVQTLIDNCRAVHPDCTLDEISHFTQFKTRQTRSASIRNPVGFILTAVPEAMRGQSLLDYRADIAARQEQGTLRNAGWETAEEAFTRLTSDKQFDSHTE